MITQPYWIKVNPCWLRVQWYHRSDKWNGEIGYCASDPLCDFCMGLQESYMIGSNRYHRIIGSYMPSIHSMLIMRRVVFLLLKHIHELQDITGTGTRVWLSLVFHSIQLTAPVAYGCKWQTKNKTKQTKKPTGVLSPIWRIYPYTIYAWLFACWHQDF